MSAYDLREHLRRRIRQEIDGDGTDQKPGLQNLALGIPVRVSTIEAYNFLIGQIRAWKMALTFLDEAYAEMHGDLENPLDHPTGDI